MSWHSSKGCQGNAKGLPRDCQGNAKGMPKECLDIVNRESQGNAKRMSR